MPSDFLAMPLALRFKLVCSQAQFYTMPLEESVFYTRHEHSSQLCTDICWIGLAIDAEHHFKLFLNFSLTRSLKVEVLIRTLATHNVVFKNETILHGLVWKCALAVLLMVYKFCCND